MLPPVTLINVVLAERSTESILTLAGVHVDPVNAGGVVGTVVVGAVVHVDLAVLARVPVLTDTLVVVGPVHAVLDPWVLSPAARLQTLVDVDLAVLTLEA